MRILLADSLLAQVGVPQLSIALQGTGASVVLNSRAKRVVGLNESRSQTDKCIFSFESFDPQSESELLSVIIKDGIGYDAIVYPPHLVGLTSHVLAAALGASLQQRLRVIGVPNDSVANIAECCQYAADHEIAIVHTPGVHARSVAEYTIAQFAFHSRRLDYFYHATGLDGAWPHAEASYTTHLLDKRTLGVIGGSGRDGSAVIALGRRCGMRVLALNSGEAAGQRRMCLAGAERANNLDNLIAESDLISINCRLGSATIGSIGRREIGLMRKGVIVVNPGNAEVFDKNALKEEFFKAAAQRRIGALILDMPFGGRRDNGAFASDPINRELRDLGVLFTPRIAGYTMESRCQAESRLYEGIGRYLSGDTTDVAIVHANIIRHSGQKRAESRLASMLNDMLTCVQEIGLELIRMREAGLSVEYKDDGSPSTNADQYAENAMKMFLRSKGHQFRFVGEESKEESAESCTDCQIIMDGIDGTRNYRDGNWGWCISVAAKLDGRTEIALIHDPTSREIYFATRGDGAFYYLHEKLRSLRVPDVLPPDFSFSVGSFRVKGSANRKAKIIDELKALGGRGRELGCVALSICGVARGGLGVFIQSNSHVHDHIAAVLIAQEAGANVVIQPVDGGDVEREDVVVSHATLSADVKRIYSE